MLIKNRPSWEISENLATPEQAFLNRRQFLGKGGIALGGSALFLSGAAGGLSTMDANAAQSDPTLDLYPAKKNASYSLDRELTPEDVNSTYNNFYEFGSHKQISSAAQALETRPWTITLDGMVEKEQVLDVDTLIRHMQLEERLYRHRCVEAWSMTIPWTGFSFAALVAYARPLSGAKYIRMETFMDPDMASGQRQTWNPWPYVEGLTMQEATNELAFLVTGAYGKPAAKQFGAPLRLAVPWKYGFKSIKSIVKFTFTDERPKSFWESIQGAEYGFWANVNPQVDHPRWSQATERVLHTGVRVPTLLFNGYAEQVAHLYKGLEGEILYR